MGREKENRALADILQGKPTEKPIRVFTGDKNDPELVKYREKLAQEKKEQEEKSALLRQFRMPLFCPECGGIMNKRLDTRFWNLRKRCFNCVIEEENEMRKNGTFEQYERKVVLENKRDWLKDQIQQVTEYKKKTSIQFLNQINPDGHHVEEENWDINSEQLQKMANEAIEAYEEELSKVETELLEV